MTSRGLHLALLLLVAGAGFGCASPESLDDEDLGEEVGSGALEIKGGTSAGAYPEAVLIEEARNGQLVSACSGALIAPTVVLTAAHCTYGFDGYRVRAPFAGGQSSMASRSAVYDWTNTSQNVDGNQHDVGLIFLDTPITLDAYPEIASSPLAGGSQVVNVGRVLNGQLSDSVLYMSKAIEVQDAASLGFPYDYTATELIEHGDSGGPDYAPNSHTIVAVNSGGGNGIALFARVDLLRSWIQEQVESGGSGGQPGGNPGGGYPGGPGGWPGGPGGGYPGGGPGGWPGNPWGWGIPCGYPGAPC